MTRKENIDEIARLLHEKHGVPMDEARATAIDIVGHYGDVRGEKPGRTDEIERQAKDGQADQRPADPTS